MYFEFKIAYYAYFTYFAYFSLFWIDLVYLSLFWLILAYFGGENILLFVKSTPVLLQRSLVVFANQSSVRFILFLPFPYLVHKFSLSNQKHQMTFFSLSIFKILPLLQGCKIFL
jgi:hypothetical protein